MAGTDPKQTFLDLLVPYFGDQTREVGLAEIVSVSARSSEFHAEILAALQAAIAAAAQGERAVLDAVRNRFLRYRRDDDAVREFLDELRSEYLRLYAEAIRGSGSS
jgi:hypothetical protein